MSDLTQTTINGLFNQLIQIRNTLNSSVNKPSNLTLSESRVVVNRDGTITRKFTFTLNVTCPLVNIQSEDNTTSLLPVNNDSQDMLTKVDFNVNNLTTPLFIKTSTNLRIGRIDVVIDERFDSNFKLSIGDTNDNSKLMDSSQIDSNNPGVYSATLYYQYIAATQLFLFASGSSANGRGTLFLYEA